MDKNKKPPILAAFLISGGDEESEFNALLIIIILHSQNAYFTHFYVVISIFETTLKNLKITKNV